MSRKKAIGIDLMGSDHSPSVLLDVLKDLSIPKDISLVAIGTSEWAEKGSFLPFALAQEAIEMEESPLTALRKKRNASMCVGMRLLKEGQLDAFVSAGNTGALISAAKMIIGTYPGFLRPALLALMPTKKKPLCVLDLGANPIVKRSHLVQFAYLGAAHQKARGIKLPTVGILNIGSEATKGTAELRAAYKQLLAVQNGPFRFVGNIEGKSAFDGEVDVLVTDGFTGNIFLKTAEGLANLILDRLHNYIPANLQRHFQYAEYPGAFLAGIQKMVIKCHGYSTPQAFANAIKGAIEHVREDFQKKLQHQIPAIKIKN